MADKAIDAGTITIFRMSKEADRKYSAVGEASFKKQCNPRISLYLRDVGPINDYAFTQTKLSETVTKL